MGYTVGVVVFIRGRWVHRGSPGGPAGSSGVAGFTGVRPGGRRVHPWSLGSLECALGSVGFIRGRFVASLECALGAIGFIRGRWVLWGALNKQYYDRLKT